MRKAIYYIFFLIGCSCIMQCDDPAPDSTPSVLQEHVALPDTLRIDIDATALGAPLPPLIGLVHATQSDMVSRYERFGVQTIKTDQIFDILSVVTRSEDGQLLCDWAALDRALHAVKQAGAVLHLGIDFTPPVLSPRPHLENSRRRSPPPVDYSQWDDLVRQAARHVREVWGEGDIYWEIWNEPDLGMFWDVDARSITRWASFARDADLWTPGVAPEAAAGELNDVARLIEYRKLYRITAAAIRETDPAARIGGPGTASFRPRWVRGMLNTHAEQGTPLDFISWHYPSWHEEVPVSVEQIRLWSETVSVETPDLIITEWNERYGDSVFLFQRALDVLGFLEAYADNGIDRSFYYGTSALFDTIGPPSPITLALEAYTRLEGDRLSVLASPGVAALATRARPDNAEVLFWSAQDGEYMLRVTFRSQAYLNTCVITLIEHSPENIYNKSIRKNVLLARSEPDKMRSFLDIAVQGPVIGTITFTGSDMEN